MAVVVLFVKVKNFRNPKRKGEVEEVRFTVLQRLVIGVRLCVSAAVSAVAVLAGVEALMLYDNLCVFAMLPVGLSRRIERKIADEG